MAAVRQVPAGSCRYCLGMTSGVSPLLPPDQYIASLARKRMAAGASFRDDDGRVLLVDPTYKPVWDLPGRGRGERGASDLAEVGGEDDDRT
jgi:hypothetical protein